MSLSRVLVDWVASVQLDTLDAARIGDARRRLIDVTGMALAAAEEPLGRAVRAGVSAQPGPAAVLGTTARLASEWAALVNGTLGHAMDFDDSHLATLVHPSAPLVATALALGEERDLALGDLLAAVVAGNEVACRLGLAAPGAFHKHGLHPTSVLCTPVAAIVAGRMMGLDRDRLVHAAGIAGSQAAGILESFQDGTWVKTLHPGWAAHAGIVAARLAAAGFTGPATVLEGRFGMLRALLDGPATALDLDAVTADLGTGWASDTNFFKVYPCAHVILPFVELARRWRAGGGAPGRIRAVEVEIGEAYVPVVLEPMAGKTAPRTPTHARASLPFCVARTLGRGRLGIDDFADAAIADGDTLALARRFTYTAKAVPVPTEGFAGALAITLDDGGRWRQELVSRRGHPREAATAEDVRRKFAELAEPVLGAERTIAALAMMEHGDPQTTTLHGLTRALSPA